VKEYEREGEEGFDAEAVYSNKNDVSSPFKAVYVTDSWVHRTLMRQLELQ
jgi:hypothetical protein